MPQTLVIVTIFLPCLMPLAKQSHTETKHIFYLTLKESEQLILYLKTRESIKCMT